MTAETPALALRPLAEGDPDASVARFRRGRVAGDLGAGLSNTEAGVSSAEARERVADLVIRIAIFKIGIKHSKIQLWISSSREGREREKAEFPRHLD